MKYGFLSRCKAHSHPLEPIYRGLLSKLGEEQVGFVEEWNCHRHEDEYDLLVVSSSIPIRRKEKAIWHHHGICPTKGDLVKDAREFFPYLKRILVSGPYFRNLCIGLGVPNEKIDMIGYPKCDHLFRPNLTKAGGYLLFAPTLYPDERLYTEVLPKLLKAASRQGLKMILKPHSLGTDPTRFVGYEGNDLHLIDKNDDVTNCFHYADILVSDVSSVLYEFALLDKPVIQLNWRPLGDWKHTDIGPIIDIENVEDAIKKTLEHPDEHKENRRRWVEKLFAFRDGSATARAVNSLLSLQD